MELVPPRIVLTNDCILPERWPMLTAKIQGVSVAVAMLLVTVVVPLLTVNDIVLLVLIDHNHLEPLLNLEIIPPDTPAPP